MATAHIELGNIGRTVAKQLAAGGERIIVAARDVGKAESFAKELGSNATGGRVLDVTQGRAAIQVQS